MIRTLAIETSCDDTSIWIISFDGKIFKTQKLLAYSQIQDHQQYWWIVPEIASRLHFDKIIQVLKKIWFAKITQIDFISVTTHPWLPGSLVVGKAVANLLWAYYDKPVIETNHIHWHIFSILLERDIYSIKFPMMVLTASGWHNDIYFVTMSQWNNATMKHFNITKIWHTLDDAAWECFDKVSRMLGGPYPWWVWISQKALQWKPNPQYQFKRIFLSKDKFEFSFSWMKSQVYKLLQNLSKNWISLSDPIICDISYEFQEAVVEVLAKKLLQAAQQYQTPSIAIAGWVSSNDRLREYLNNLSLKHSNLPTGQAGLPTGQAGIQIFKPTKKVYSTDNAAMIWVAGILKYLKMIE